MNVPNFQERLERVGPQIKLKVATMLNYLFENSENFDEISEILDTVNIIVKEEIKKVDTKKFKGKASQPDNGGS
jgi:hypothetical protein